jgi:hypothetical protein
MGSRKTKNTGIVDDDGSPIELEDVEKEGDGGLGTREWSRGGYWT